MGKIFKSILNSFLIASVNCQDSNDGNNEPFQVTDCNDDSGRPALTYKIAEDYFRTNLSGQEGNYDPLENGFYTRTITEADLALSFGTNDNDEEVIILSYSVATGANGFDISNSARVSFGQNSLEFQCQYSRTVNVDDSMSIDPVDQDSIVGTGNLGYTMTVDVPSGVGGTTTVTISP